MKTKDQKSLNEISETMDLSESSLKKGLPSGWMRTTIVLREEFFEKLKDVSYWERVHVKDLFDEMLESFLSMKKTQPRPKERKKVFEKPF